MPFGAAAITTRRLWYGGSTIRTRIPTVWVPGYNPHTGAWARLCRIRSVWRRWDGCVLQSSNGDLCTRCYRLRSLWVTLGRPGLQPSDRNLRPNATGLERLRKLGYELSVQRGDSWAQTAHRENHRTGQTTSGIRTSEGGGAVSRTGPGGDRTTVGRTGSGDVYAGHDGNVYRKNDSGGWSRLTQVTGRRRTAPTRVIARRRAVLAQTSQLERDASARSSGDQRSTSRSTWQQGGSTRSGPKLRGRWTGAQRRRASTLAPVLQIAPPATPAFRSISV